MKNSLSILGLFLISAILFSSCTNKSPRINENKIIEPQKQSLWTDDMKRDFISSNAKTDFEKFILSQLVSENEFHKNLTELKELIQLQGFDNYRRTNSRKYVVNVDDLAGKSKADIEKILGKPNNKQKVNPSNTPCPCDQYNYLYDLVEVIFMKGKADWITINNFSSFVKINNPTAFISVSRFDDYTYVKVSTR